MPSVAKQKDLKAMKRNELQRLAKLHGVKANMKNDGIIAALQKIFNSEKENQPKDELKTESFSVETPNSQISTPLSNLGEDLMSVKPPWENSDLICFDSTPEPDSLDKSNNQASLSKSPQKKTGAGQRTRSSSRNRTPKSSNSDQPAATKTFSVERNKAKPRTNAKRGIRNKQKANKRRSVNTTDEIQSKRMRKNSNEAESKNDESIDEILQKEILDEIRKKIEATDGKNPDKAKANGTFGSRIPRFAATGVTIGTSKPITPGNKDWKKIHNKRFQNLESIDDYERRKKERAERLLGSNQKKNATLSRLAQPSKRGRPKIVKPVVTRGRPVPSFASPAPARLAPKTPQSIIKATKSSTKGEPPKPKSPKTSGSSAFKPTITSTKKMNLNFTQSSSKAATPKRVTIVSDQGDKNQTYIKTPATGMRNRSILTPSEKRKMSALNTSVNNTSTPGGTKKPVFDLKKSLKKPMTWVPHKGPLRPFNDAPKKPTFQDRMKDIKEPNAANREKRKQKMAAEKKQAKDKRMMLRRGIK